MKRMKRKQNSNLEFLIITYTFAVLFLGIMVYLVWFIWKDSADVINNAYNPRQEILAEKNVRGRILASGGEILAETLINDDGTETRVYPYGSLFAHAVGYSAYGRMGVEALADFYLLTSNEPLEDKIRNGINSSKNNGDSVVTTLRTDLQQTAYEALGIYDGAIIVTEIATGKILAMVSKPDFDPNEIAAIWAVIIEEENNSVLVNRVTQGLYPPGSTFKIVTALEYIRENPNTYGNYSFSCNGQIRIGTDTIHCFHGISHGNEDLRKSFARSCNSSFASIGYSLNKEAFQKTLTKLLFDQDLPVGMSYSRSKVNIMDEAGNSDLLQTAIGQGKTQMTPLHVAMITAAIANNGVLMRPYLIDSVINERGSAVRQYNAQKYGSLMTAEEAAILRELMMEVVLSGTATKLNGLSYTAAGKTGSAEYTNKKEESHAWFTGFAPAEQPEIAVTIIVEGAGSGGDYAVPIAKRIFDQYFK